MYSLTQPKQSTPLFVVVLMLACFALLPTAQAVVPPPDGGYPGFNTAEGSNALQNLTTGIGNTATGWRSLFANTAGNLNTAIGAGTLLFNTGDNNTATGGAALLSNTTGVASTANGAFALLSNTTGSGNTGSGYQALFSNQTGANNAAYGYTALYNNTGSFNTAFGSQTLVYNTLADANTAVGYQASVFNTSGDLNTAVGYRALYSNATGNENAAFGEEALANATGNYNVALGRLAGFNVTTGDNNIEIGTPGLAGDSGTIRIGNNLQTTTYIAGIAGQTVGAGGTTCYVDNDGKLGVFLSARRFKTDIADMGAASEALLALRPVTFHYKPKLDKTGIPQFGLVAEEVEKVNPDLVTHDAKGDIYTVRYEAVSVMLLNEFLKQHNAFLQEQRKVQRLEAALDAVNQRLKEQEAKIEKVSVQIEVNKPGSQVVRTP
jgi:Chaperone of endosialidase